MPRMLKNYMYLIIFIGMVILIYIVPQAQLSSLYMVLIIGAIAGFLDQFPIELPNGTLFSGGNFLTLVVMAIWGIPEAAIVEITIAIVLLLFSREELLKSFYNLFQFLICIVLAGYSYILIGGQIGSFGLDDIPRLLFALAIYNITNISLLSIAISIFKQEGFVVTWIEMAQDTILIYIVTALLSLRLAYVYESNDLTQFWIEAIFIVIIFHALRYSFKLFIDLRKTYLTSMESLTHLTETKLSINEGHATRVGRISRLIAEGLNLPQNDIDTIHYAALLHDVGKAQLDEQMFRKRGPLTLEEEAEYKNHVAIGAEMVKEIIGLEKASEYILYHHEQWGGKGFPEGKKGEEIPLGARIITVANEYDHLISDEKLQDPKLEFEKLAGQKLDPKLVEIVLEFADFKKEEQSISPEIAIENKLIENIVINKTRNKFYQSKLLEKFGASLIVNYDVMFRDEQGKGMSVPCEDEVLHLVQKAKSQNSRTREFVEDHETGKVYDIYCVPFGQQVKVMFFDVSHLLDYEKKQEEHVKTLYRDVIFSVTQGKLLLTDDEGMTNIFQAEQVAQVPILSKLDVGLCRDHVQKVVDELSISDKSKFNLLLCTSEAATNVLKHSTEGQMRIFQTEEVIRVVIEDYGSGMKLSDIPKSTLLSGYSSKVSMGKGFSLLLKLLDRVILNTGPTGTTVVLEMKFEREEEG